MVAQSGAPRTVLKMSYDSGTLAAEYLQLAQTAVLRAHEEDVEGVRSGLTGLTSALGTDVRAFLLDEYPALLAASLDRLETEDERRSVLNALLEFFARYYRDGEFDTSRRRGQSGARVEAAGDDDVIFRWRNRGAHYVKSAVRLGHQTRLTANGGRVLVRVADVAGPRDNNKPELLVHQLEGVEADELGVVVSMRWDRHPDVSEKKQRPAAQAAEVDKAAAAAVAACSTVTEDDARVALRRFIRESNTDFLVHPSLAPFLTQELHAYLVDSFLGEEIASLPGHEALRRIEQVQVAAAVAEPVIRQLGALESVKAQLFEKLRVVLDERWLVRIDQVPEDLWPAVLANEAQQAAWADLFGLAGPATTETLSERPGLVLDTKHFPEEFTTELLCRITETSALDQLVDGVVVAGENYGAMRTLMPTFQGRLKVAYLDVPYNTGSDGFLYKDAFGRHSTWLVMMEERMRLVRDLLGPDGALLVSIDDNEEANCKQLLDVVFGERNYVTTLTWEGALKGDATFVSEGHDSIHAYLRNAAYLEERIRAWKREVEAAKKAEEEIPESPFAWKTAKGGTKKVIDKGKELTAAHKITADLALDEYLRRCWAASKDLQAWYKTLEETDPAKDFAGTYKYVDHLGTYRADNPSWPGGGGPDYAPEHPLVAGYRCPPPTRGWRLQEDRFWEEHAARRTHWPEDHTKQPCPKKYLEQQTKSVLRSVFYGNRASAGRRLDDVIGGKGAFPHPKHPEIVRQLVEAASDPDAWVLDVFAGSGTTAAAVIEQNRREITPDNPVGGNRRFLLAEMGDYLEDITLRRITRLMHSQEWKRGAPVPPKRKQTWAGLAEGGPRIVQVLRTESFDQTLATVLASDAVVTRTVKALHPDLRLDELSLDIPGTTVAGSVVDESGTRTTIAAMPTALLALGIEARRHWLIGAGGYRHRVVTGVRRDGTPAAVVLREPTSDLDADAVALGDVLTQVGAGPDWEVYVNAPCIHPQADDLETAVAESVLSRDPHVD